MANLTLSVDDATLRAARIRALEQGTSVNALVRKYLDTFAGRHDHREALARMFERADRTGASSGPSGRTWTRDELYDRWERHHGA